MKADLATLHDAPASRWPALVQTVQWLMNPVGFMDRGSARFGKVFALDVLGWGRLVLIGDAELAGQVFAAPPPALSAAEANRILEPVVGPASVFVLEGAPHREARRLLKPALSPNRFEELGHAALPIVARWGADLCSEIPLDRQLRRLTMQMMVRVLFGREMPDLAGTLERRIAPLLGFLASVLAFVPSLQRDLGPWSPVRLLKRRLRSFHETLDECWSARTSSDHLGALFASEGETTDPFVRDQLTSVLIAGYDTTAAGIAWACYWIRDRPEVVAALRAEHAGLPSADTPEYVGALLALPYLDAVCSEALRLVPVVDFYPRQIGSTDGSGRRPTFAAPCSYLIHNDPGIFEQPDQFRPERFLGETTGRSLMPYGGGARRCPGAELSRLLTKIVLAQLIVSGSLQIESRGTRAVRRNVVLLPPAMRFSAPSPVVSATL